MISPVYFLTNRLLCRLGAILLKKLSPASEYRCRFGVPLSMCIGGVGSRTVSTDRVSLCPCVDVVFVVHVLLLLLLHNAVLVSVTTTRRPSCLVLLVDSV